MRKWLIILAFLPVVGFGQRIVYADIDWSRVTDGYMTTGKIDTVFDDFPSIYNSGYSDSTSVETDNEGNTYLRAYSPPNISWGGGSESCDIESPTFFVSGFITDSTVYQAYVTFMFKASPNFVGGDAGGKIMSLKSQLRADTVAWSMTLSFENEDTLMNFYYDDGERPYSLPSESQYSTFRWHNDKWYNITMRVDCGTENNTDGSFALYIDGICIGVVDGLNFLNSTTDESIAQLDYYHFFGGGGCSPDFDVWLNYGHSALWWPTPQAISNGDYPARGVAPEVGDTIELPIDFACNDWTECVGYDWVTRTCTTSATIIDGRIDGVCSGESESYDTTNYEHLVFDTVPGEYGVNGYGLSQSFTVGTVGLNEDHVLDSIGVMIKTEDVTDSITFKIYKALNDTLTGSALSYGVLKSNFPTILTIKHIDMTDYTLQPDSSYVIVATVHGPGYLKWAQYDNGYSGGMDAYISSGSWVTEPAYDFWFEIYGTTTSSVTTKTSTYRGIYSISDYKKRGLSLNPSYRGINYE